MDIPISRSEQKRRIKDLEKLVEELSKLSSAAIDSLSCGKEIIGHLRRVSSLQGSARKRELKYITKLMRNDYETVDRLYRYMEQKQGADLQEKKAFHELEYVRDALLNEAIAQLKNAEQRQEVFEENWSSRVLEEINREYPQADRSLMGRLAWMYARTRNRKHSREIFRLLRAAREQQRFARQKDLYNTDQDKQ